MMPLYNNCVFRFGNCSGMLSIPAGYIIGFLLIMTQSNGMRTLESVDDQGGSITIAAIDNGLAFPFKHPDEWRACEPFNNSALQLTMVLIQAYC